jgi:hypothetical protein
MQARVWQTSHLAVVAGVLVFVLGGTAFEQSNPFIGTWNVNFAKSKYNPGPPPKSDTRVAEPWETNGLKFTATGVGRMARLLLKEPLFIMTAKITSTLAHRLSTPSRSNA